MNHIELPCVKRYPEQQSLIDDRRFITSPEYIGNKILICGRKKSHFPFHCMVGPDWFCMLITYCLIIIPSVLFTIYIADVISIVLTILSSISLALLLGFYSYAACSDPGIVYKDNYIVEPEIEEMSSTKVGMIECSQCQIMRPCTAMHCYDCGVCVEELDHHCPWTGKCIGKKTLQAFYGFLTILVVHLLYVGGVCLYYISFRRT